MKSTIEAIEYAKEYLWNGLIKERKTKPASEMNLHRALQYKLCECVDRLISNFGYFSREHVALLVESWVMAQGTHQPAKPLDVMEISLNDL